MLSAENTARKNNISQNSFVLSGGFRGQITTLAHINVQPVMESQLFTESQKISLWWKYDAAKLGAIAQSHTKYRGKMKKNGDFYQYFQKYLSLSVWLKVRFYQVLDV